MESRLQQHEISFEICENLSIILILIRGTHNQASRSRENLKICLCALTEHHAMKACWGSGGIAPLILYVGTRLEVSGQLHTPDALPPGKVPLVPIG
jgi:hypothetical protein